MAPGQVVIAPYLADPVHTVENLTHKDVGNYDKLKKVILDRYSILEDIFWVNAEP